MNAVDEEIAEWIELYSRPLLNRALAQVASKEDAADLVQEVFISAVSSYGAFERKSSPLTWLLNILKNKTADFYRKKYRAPRIKTASDFFDSSGAWVDHSVLYEWPDNSADVEGRHALFEALDKCIERLPVRWRATIRLYYLKEKNAESVCQELNLAAANLWKILQRSRMQLRKCLELNYFNSL